MVISSFSSKTKLHIIYSNAASAFGFAPYLDDLLSPELISFAGGCENEEMQYDNMEGDNYEGQKVLPKLFKQS